MCETIEGIVPPLVTPLTDAGVLDFEGTERVLEHVIGGGVAGVFLLGTCGEGPALSFEVRRDFVLHVSREVSGRVKVLVGVSSPSLAESLEMAEIAAEGAADAIVATVPYYFPVDEVARLGWLEMLADRSPLPLIVYNMPCCVGSELSPGALGQLAHHPRIEGIKDSGGCMEVFSRYVAASAMRPEWTRMVGPEHLLVEAVRRGATGGINGGAVVCPRLYVQLFDAARRNDTAVITRLQPMVDVVGRLYGQPCTVGSVIRGLKSAAHRLGLIGPAVTEVFESLAAPSPTVVDTVIHHLCQEKLLDPSLYAVSEV